VNLDQALGMIREAVVAEPENAAYLDSLAWVLHRLGRSEEALPHMEKAAKLLEDDPDSTVLDHLGDILAALKRFPEAKEHWRRALELDPAPEIRKKLEAAPK
jgi:tetratricopeptide (TPR) repeat protein